MKKGFFETFLRLNAIANALFIHPTHYFRHFRKFDRLAIVSSFVELSQFVSDFHEVSTLKLHKAFPIDSVEWAARERDVSKWGNFRLKTN